MKQRLEQKLEQRLAPYQLLFMDLLETPYMDLREEIERITHTNPMLEMNEPPESNQFNEEEEETPMASTEEEGPEEVLPDPQEPSDLIDEMQYFLDQDSYYEEKEPETEKRSFQFRSPISLYEHLRQQIQEYPLSEKQKRIAEYIIGNLDSNGYLYLPSSEKETHNRKLLTDIYSPAYLAGVIDRIRRELKMKEGIETNNEEVEKVLHLVQNLSPAGVGARNLQECLLIQLKQMPPAPIRDKAIQILSHHFKDFTHKHYDKLLQRYHLTDQELKKILELIKRLNPKPAAALTSAPEQEKEITIIPELYLEYDENGEPFVTLRETYIPKLRISHRYLNRLEELKKKQIAGKPLTPSEKDELEYLQRKWEHAKWIIEAIQMRQNTLLTIGQTIVNEQKEFFLNDEDPKFLKPLILEQIAKKVNRDISTVSRATRGKYLQTPFNVYPLRYFFTDKLQTTDGETISNTAVKEMIKELIQNEDKQNPYTDDQIAQLLHEKGIQLSRRTVSKYRELMGIPSARLRKELD
jgi:RNA polymerase sigma-54 factor